MVKVSVIIINFNSDEFLSLCLLAIAKYTTCNHEIIVVDNASASMNQEKFHSDFPKVKFIFNTQNLGFAKANNQGISVASGEYVFLLNPDAFLQSNAIDEFLKFMDNSANQNVACCGGNLKLPDGSPQVSFGNFPSLMEALSILGFYHLYRSYFNRKLSSAVKSIGKNSFFYVDYVSGADLFIRRSILLETGLFNEDFFLYFEETELCYRFNQLGYKSVLLPLVEIIHLEGCNQQNGNHFSKSKYEFFAKSRKLFFTRCYGPLSAMLMSIFYTTHHLLRYVVKRDKMALLFAKITWKA